MNLVQPSTLPDGDGHPDGELELSILIVTYNAAQHVLTCLYSIFAYPPSVPFEILLIDNGTDGSAELVQEQFPQVGLVVSEGNIGFGAGNNRLAKASRGRFLLLLNPDTEVRDDALDRLLEFRRNYPSAGAWGGRTRSQDGQLDGGNFIVFPTLSRMFLAMLGLSDPHPHGTLSPAAVVPGIVDVLPGGFFLISRSTWTELEGFDESFFLYSEEVDLFLRLQRMGLHAWTSPDISIVHDVGSGNHLSVSRTWFKTTGQMHYCRKHWRRSTIVLAGIMIWISGCLRLIRACIKQPTSTRSKSLRQAYAPIVSNPAGWWRGYEDGRGSIPPSVN